MLMQKKIGRPKLVDPRVSCHVPLSRDERRRCNTVATMIGLPFATWARMRLLDAVAATEANAAASKSTLAT